MKAHIDIPSAVGGLAVGAVAGYFLNRWMQSRSQQQTQLTVTPPPSFYAGGLQTGPAGQLSPALTAWVQYGRDHATEELASMGLDCRAWLSLSPAQKLRALDAVHSGFFEPSKPVGWDAAEIIGIDAHCTAQTQAAIQAAIAATQPPQPAEQFREPSDADIARFLAPWGGCEKWTQVTPGVKVSAAARWQGSHFASMFLARVNAYCLRWAVQHQQRRNIGLGTTALIARPMVRG